MLRCNSDLENGALDVLTTCKQFELRFCLSHCLTDTSSNLAALVQWHSCNTSHALSCHNPQHRADTSNIEQLLHFDLPNDMQWN